MIALLHIAAKANEQLVAKLGEPSKKTHVSSSPPAWALPKRCAKILWGPFWRRLRLHH